MSGHSSYERLLRLGKEQGGLTAHDLERVLPIDRMSMDELSDVLARLEDAGIPVEIDPALLSPASRNPALGSLDTLTTLPQHTEPRAQDPVTPAKPDIRPSRPQSPAAPSPIISVYHAYIRDKTVWVAVMVALGAILLVALFLIIKPWNFL
jgi:sigma-70-like protein